MDEIIKNFDEWLHMESQLLRAKPDQELSEVYLGIRSISKNSKNLENFEIIRKL